MGTQVMGQSSGGGSLFSNSGNMGMALPSDMYDLHDLSKAELAAPQLIMLANVALTGEVNGNCCDYLVGEDRQMAELMPVGDNHFSDSDGEGLEDEAADLKGEAAGLENMELRSLELGVEEPQPVFQAPAAPEVYSSNKDGPPEAGGAEDKCKNPKTKPFRCKPCQYEAESEEQFVHHIRVHSAKKFFVEESAEKQAKARESGASPPSEEGDFSKGPIRCDRCGYNTNRYDHYTAHLKHHTRAGDNERVYKCIICTYTTVSEYHWRKHLRNHFPRKVYTCGKCNYFSDRKNNYVQHVRTHTGERPYKCELCPYSSSQKTHLTRHMRTHSGEKPFKCDQCSYVASNQHEVTRHARQVHNGPKPLNCPHCDYKTADRSNFKKHVELHVNPRQFNCPVCDYAASKKCNLQYHFKSKHPTCPNKTMDVSKVKLKKTKKREADLHDSITNEKTEAEQTKIKGDLSGRKNEKSMKVEKKDNAPKEKKSCSNTSVMQVTTRTRKSATETKEMDAHAGNNSEKPSKAKKNKRKLDAETHSLRDAVNEEPMAKKKKKIENRSRSSPEVPKDQSKAEEHKEENKKQSACVKKSAKKKIPKNKSSKKSKSAPKEAAPKKPVPKGAAPREASPKGAAPKRPPVREAAKEAPAPTEPLMEPAPMELSALPEPTQVQTSPADPAQMELPPPVGDTQMEPLPPVGDTQMEPLPPVGDAQSEPRPPVGDAQMEPLPPVGDAQSEPRPPVGDAQSELRPPVGDAQSELRPLVGAAQTELPCPLELPPPPPAELPPLTTQPLQMGLQNRPAQGDPPLQIKAVTKRSSPRKDSNKKEKLNAQSEMARQEQVLIEVGLVPVRERRLRQGSESSRGVSAPAPAPQPLEGSSRGGTGKDQSMLSEDKANEKDSLEKGGAAETHQSPADPAASQESARVASSEQNLTMAQGEGSQGEEIDDKSETSSMTVCETEMDIEQSTAENVPGEDLVGAAEPAPLSLAERGAVAQAVSVSPPATVAESESQEVDEDEGIHSHDGSDLSDNMSEGSDDSGLHGARQGPQETSTKDAKEALALKATEGDFVCIFCDRSFRKEKDYSKHLNRHLVNVYFLEKAAKGQE